MDSFSISDLQQFTGIKAHTIRIWEQRYNALTPKRSEGNTRYYDNSQLRRLLNISSLINDKYKVSEVCSMTDEQMFRILKERLNNSHDAIDQKYQFVSQMVIASISYDEAHFERIFSGSLLRYGLKETYLGVLYPLLERLGLMWSSNMLPPSQEHFATNLIRQKIITAIDALPRNQLQAETWLLFLPENEFHEIGLLFANYLIQAAGKKVIYLGANVPFESLGSMVQTINPDHVYLFMVHQLLPGNIVEYIHDLKKLFHKSSIHISGNSKILGEIKAGKNLNMIRTVTDLEQLIK